MEQINKGAISLRPNGTCLPTHPHGVPYSQRDSRPSENKQKGKYLEEFSSATLIQQRIRKMINNKNKNKTERIDVLVANIKPISSATIETAKDQECPWCEAGPSICGFVCQCKLHPKTLPEYNSDPASDTDDESCPSSPVLCTQPEPDSPKENRPHIIAPPSHDSPSGSHQSNTPHVDWIQLLKRDGLNNHPPDWVKVLIKECEIARKDELPINIISRVAMQFTHTMHSEILHDNPGNFEKLGGLLRNVLDCEINLHYNQHIQKSRKTTHVHTPEPSATNPKASLNQYVETPDNVKQAWREIIYEESTRAKELGVPSDLVHDISAIYLSKIDGKSTTNLTVTQWAKIAVKLAFQLRKDLGKYLTPGNHAHMFLLLSRAYQHTKHNPNVPTATIHPYLKLIANFLGTHSPKKTTLNAIQAVLTSMSHRNLYPQQKAACEEFNCSERCFRFYHNLLNKLLAAAYTLSHSLATNNQPEHQTTQNALVVQIIEDTPTSHVPIQDALTTETQESLSELPIPTIVDSGCAVDTEYGPGLLGFEGTQQPCQVTLVTGTEEATRPQYQATHRQYLIDVNDEIIEDVRHGVYSMSNTPFKRSLFSPNTAAERGITTVILPPAQGPSYLLFPTKKGSRRVALCNNGKSYILHRYITRESAEKALKNRSPAPNLDPVPALETKTTDQIEDTSEAMLWHRRLGHRSISILPLLKDHCLDGPSINQLRPLTRATLDACAICPAARLKRKPQTKNPTHPHHFSASIEKFGSLVARDHMGPLTSSFQHSYCWGLILVDAYTGAVFFYPQRTKSAEDTLSATKRFETDTVHLGNILRYHSDAANELMGTMMHQHCENKKPPTKLTYNTRAASNSNALGENGVYRIVSIARALLIDSGIPQEHWAAACQHASDIIYATPRLYTNNEMKVISTPHFMATNRKPSLKKFKLFGCIVHALLDPDRIKQDKTNNRFGSRCIVGFFMGNSRQYVGGVRIWVPGEPKYIHALTVKYDETRTYRSLCQPKKLLLSTDLSPVDTISRGSASHGSTITLTSLFNQGDATNTPGTTDNMSIPPGIAHEKPKANNSSEGLVDEKNENKDELTHAADIRPGQPTRINRGTRILVFCDNKRYYPGTIVAQRPGEGNTIHHGIIYDGYRRRYFHDLDEEDWKYEEDLTSKTRQKFTSSPDSSSILQLTRAPAPRIENTTPPAEADPEEPSPHVTPTETDCEEPTTLAPPAETDHEESPAHDPPAETDSEEPTVDIPPAEEASKEPPEKRSRRQVRFYMHEPPAAQHLSKEKASHMNALSTTVTETPPDKQEQAEGGTLEADTDNNGYEILPHTSNIILNMFSGEYNRPDGLTAALRKRGYVVEELDNSKKGGGYDGDLLNDTVYNTILGHALKGKYRAVYAAPPCSTFSVARFFPGPEPNNYGPPVIRTKSHVMGIPDIPPQHKEELRKANLLVARCAAIVTAIADNHGSFLIENPAGRGSLDQPDTYDPRFKDHAPLWLMPDILKIQQKYKATLITFPACAIGAPFQKLTSILISRDFIPALQYLSNLKCTHKKGEHVRIAGYTADGKWFSNQSAKYGQELCEVFASALPIITDVNSAPFSSNQDYDKYPPRKEDEDEMRDPSDKTIEWEDLHALATSIVDSGRSNNIHDYTLGTLKSQHQDEEDHQLCPYPLPLEEGEHELYYILATTLADTKMVLDESGKLVSRKVPRTYDEAISLPDSAEYWTAMRVEVDSHEKIPSYKLVEKPPGARVLPSIWAYDLKLDQHLKVKRHKARLCCGGHRARHGYEYFYKHSTTTSLDAFRIFVAMSAYRGWLIKEEDYSTAYLNAELTNEVYMHQPRGFTKYAPDGQPYVCRLLRALYGLPQSGRLWQLTHTTALLDIGFTQCIAEHALFKKEDEDGNKLFLCINVDNIYSSTNCEKLRENVMDQLREKFELNPLGTVEHTLGVRVRQFPKAHLITLDQEQYIHSLTEKFSLHDPNKHIKDRATPYASGLIDLQPLRDDHPLVAKWKSPCLRIAGALNWVAAFTRPDISFALNQCMRCIGGAHEEVYNALLHILGYLSRTADRRVNYGRDVDSPLRNHVLDHTRNLRFDIFQPGDPITFVDAGGGSKPTQCCYIFLLGGVVSMRVSKLTSTVLSVCEAEWHAATTGAARLMALEPLLEFLEIPHKPPFVILCDNKSACMLSDSDHTTKRMRHVMTRLHYLQEHVDRGKIFLVHIQTEGNLADIGTKPHTGKTLNRLASLMFLP